MKWILNVDKKYKLPYILLNTFLIFFDSIGFIIPIMVGYLVDRVTIEQNYEYLFLLSLGFICFVIIKYLGAYFTVIKLNIVSLKIISKIKEMCYQNLNKLDSYFYEHNNRGEIMTNLTSDLNNIEHHIGYNIKTIGAISLVFLGSFIYLLTINIPFTFILLTPGLLAGYISYRFYKKIKPEYEKSREYTSETNNFISDNIEANKVVKTFSLELDEIKRMKKFNLKLINKDIENGFMENNFLAKLDFIGYFTNVLFLLIGGYLFIHNKLTMGELIIFNALLYNIRAPFLRFGSLLNSIQRYSVSKNKILKLLDAKPKIKLEGKNKLDSLLVPIEFKDVRIVYDNKVVLENLNLKIKPYETIAFIGKTGSGKSSIVNLLLGFVVPESGHIFINNKNYLDYDMKDIRQKVGYVTQSAFLFSDSIYNNIRYGNYSISKEEAQKLSKLACCDFIETLPEGIDTIIGEKGVGLSGGEKQRLSLARALAVKPDILLLDDITSALDIETEEKINKSINELDYKSTKIIIASKIVSVKNADHIYVLDHGKVVESGTHQELLNKKGYYYELYNIQKGEN